MAATTMPSPTQTTNSFYDQLKDTFSTITFEEGADFCWSPTNQKIIFHKAHPQVASLLLHEVGHALLKHKDFTHDIELLQMEAAAWHAAATLAKDFGLTIDSTIIEDCLDTYREWLQERSLCPVCTQTAIQHQNTYNCINCRYSWRVNDALFCQIRKTAVRQPNRAQTE